MLIRNLVVAFSLYSRIPMPQFEWTADDMKYNLAFLPFVGLLIAGAEYLCFVLASKLGLGGLFSTALFSAVPLLITGGFHLDGFMDTQDALRSYKSKEEKLDILKDPHIGAFAVIGLLTYSVVWAGALSLATEKRDLNYFLMFMLCFVLSRILSGISSLVMAKAKKEGMLNEETKSSGKGCLIALLFELFILLVIMAFVNLFVTSGFVAALSIFFLYYRDKTHKEFGGVTGDTAGYFLSMAELIMVVVLAICTLLPY